VAGVNRGSEELEVEGGRDCRTHVIIFGCFLDRKTFLIDSFVEKAIKERDFQ